MTTTTPPADSAADAPTDAPATLPTVDQLPGLVRDLQLALSEIASMVTGLFHRVGHVEQRTGLTAAAVGAHAVTDSVDDIGGAEIIIRQ